MSVLGAVLISWAGKTATRHAYHRNLYTKILWLERGLNVNACLVTVSPAHEICINNAMTLLRHSVCIEFAKDNALVTQAADITSRQHLIPSY